MVVVPVAGVGDLGVCASKLLERRGSDRDQKKEPGVAAGVAGIVP